MPPLRRSRARRPASTTSTPTTNWRWPASLPTCSSDGWALVAGSVHPWFSGGKKEAKAAGVIAYHEYTIISFDATAKTLELRNPWGYEHITGLSLAKFKQFFRRFWGVPTK